MTCPMGGVPSIDLKFWPSLLLLVLVFLIHVPGAIAASALLEWEPSPSADVVAYDVYVGERSGVYYAVIYASNTNRLRVDHLVPGKDYYFAAKAITSTGLESPFSNEVWFRPVATQPSGAALALWRGEDGFMILNGSGIPQSQLTVETSEDLSSWSEAGTVTVTDKGTFSFTDPSSDADKKFYRIRSF